MEPKVLRQFMCAALLTPLPIFAQFKCVGPDGSTSFQQAPCAAASKQARLEIKYERAPEAAAADALSAKPTKSVSSDVTRLAVMERDRHVRDLQFAIRDTESAIAARTAAMHAELQQITQRQGSTNNNLAGATLRQSLSVDMQATTTKYQTLNDIDMDRLKSLRAELTALQQTSR